MSDDNLSAIFEKYLPSVQDEKRLAFLDRMRAYYAKFRNHRDNAMNYEIGAEYQDELFTLAVLEADDYWVHSPQFKRTVALTISQLFKTKIMQVSISSPVPVSQDSVFVDSHLNRWIMSIAAQQGKLSVGMRFPRSNSKVQIPSLLSEKSISDPSVNSVVLVADAGAWHED